MPSLNTKLASAPNTQTNYVLKATSSTTIGNSLIFDNGTNVGIGNTNPFAGATSLTGLAISDRGGLFKLAVNDVVYLSNNLYYDGANWKRITANGGTFMQLEAVDGGTLRIFGAATGSAGSNATTIDRLMINSLGNVGIGTGSPAYKLEVNGIIAGRATGNGGRFETIDSTTGANLTINPAFNSGEPAIQTQTNSPILFAPNNAERMRITSGGLLNLGTSGGSGRLNVLANPANNVLVEWQNSAGVPVGTVTVVGAGTQTAYNTTFSDLKLKKNIEDWNENVSEIFKNSNPKIFNFNYQEDTDEKIKGFIAQELYDYFPEAYPINENGHHTFNPSGMTIYLMKAVQELSSKISEQQAQIEELKALINK